MKTKEEWVKEISCDTSACSYDYVESMDNANKELIAQIQLDAYKQGMMDAANIAKISFKLEYLYAHLIKYAHELIKLP